MMVFHLMLIFGVLFLALFVFFNYSKVSQKKQNISYIILILFLISGSIYFGFFPQYKDFPLISFIESTEFTKGVLVESYGVVLEVLLFSVIVPILLFVRRKLTEKKEFKLYFLEFNNRLDKFLDLFLELFKIYDYREYYENNSGEKSILSGPEKNVFGDVFEKLYSIKFFIHKNDLFDYLKNIDDDDIKIFYSELLEGVRDYDSFMNQLTNRTQLFDTFYTYKKPIDHIKGVTRKIISLKGKSEDRYLGNIKDLKSFLGNFVFFTEQTLNSHVFWARKIGKETREAPERMQLLMRIQNDMIMAERSPSMKRIVLEDMLDFFETTGKHLQDDEEGKNIYEFLKKRKEEWIASDNQDQNQEEDN